MYFGMGWVVPFTYHITILILLNIVIHIYKYKYSLYDIINKYCISEHKNKIYILKLQNSF